MSVHVVVVFTVNRVVFSHYLLLLFDEKKEFLVHMCFFLCIASNRSPV